MAEEFQSLLERISKEYLAKAEAQADAVLKDARVQAEALLADARVQADKLRAQAENDAEAARRRAEAAMKQAARDMVLGLREELARRLFRVLADKTAEAMTPERMAELVRAMALAADAESVTVLASAGDAGALQSLLKGSLRESFRAEPEVFPNRNIRAGMQVAFNGEDLYADLTDGAVCELLKPHLGGELARLLET